MPQAHIDAQFGVTGEMLLGALVDLGSSIERIEDAIATLGVGTVKLAWAQVRRGGERACAVRVHAPEQAPDLPSWPRVREVLSFVAVPDVVRDHAMEAVGRLVTAEAEAADVAVDDMELPALGVLDTIAVILGVAAAIHELALDDVTIGPIGVGSGSVETFAGPQEVPAPAVRALLAGFPLLHRPVARVLTTGTGAALAATFARPGSEPDPPNVLRVGTGAGARSERNDRVLRVLLTG